MSVSRAVATLQRNGRIQVETDPSNRRRKVLRLTEEGERLYELMQPQTEAVADFLVAGLSKADVAKLDELLGKLIARLEARDEEGNSLFIESTKPAEDRGA
jgi:DNA-binding MarR family transcriptional regulator